MAALDEILETLWEIPELPRDWEEGLSGSRLAKSPKAMAKSNLTGEQGTWGEYLAETASESVVSESTLPEAYSPRWLSEVTTDVSPEPSPHFTPQSSPQVSTAQSSPQIFPPRSRPPGARPRPSPTPAAANVAKGPNTWMVPPPLTTMDPWRVSEATTRPNFEEPRSLISDDENSEGGTESGFHGEYFVHPLLISLT